MFFTFELLDQGQRSHYSGPNEATLQSAMDAFYARHC